MDLSLIIDQNRRRWKGIRQNNLMFEYYPQFEYYLAQIQLVLFMLAMGTTLTLKDFTPVFQQPRDLIYGLANQLVLFSVLAVLFNYLFQLPPGIAVGLLLVAALPGGTLSNVFTYLSRGNVALSVALTACATASSIITIPLVLRWLASSYVPPDFHMPVGKIMRDIFLFLLVPLVAGMLLARFLPRWQKWVCRVCLYLGFAFVVVLVIGSLGSGRVHPQAEHWRIAAAIILFCLVTQQLSMLPYRLLRQPAANTVAIGIEVTIRNINLGLLLVSLLFPADRDSYGLGKDVLFVVLYYGAVSMFVGLPLSLRMRWTIDKQRAKAATESAAAAPAELLESESSEVFS